MKSTTLTTLLLLAFAVGKAQVNPTARVANYGGTPTIIVDSIEMDQNVMNRINPDNIEKIDVLRNAKYPNGVIYISLKDHSAIGAVPKLLSLQQITDEQLHAEDKLKSRIYLLDGRLVTDTTNLRIDANSYHSVHVVPASDAPYFKTALPNTLLIIISTFDPKGKVWIRGTSLE